jgi:hypothetical protein
MRAAKILLFSFITLSLGQAVRADEVNANSFLEARLGLAGLTPMTDAEALEVRGLGRIAGASGFGLVSGLVYDPATGSNFTLSNTQASKSTDSGAGGAYADSQQVAAINFQLTLGGSSNFSATIFGLVRGGGVAISR